MNKKGFAVSSIIYSILVLFILLVLSLLGILGSRKLVFDKFKNDVMNKLNGIEGPVYGDRSGANAPELYDAMIPVKYENNNWVYADVTKKWYDYDNKEWANAVVLNDGIVKTVGDVISESDIALWYVWIPRYKYQLFNVGTTGVQEQEINIVFESGTNTTGTVKCQDAINVNVDPEVPTATYENNLKPSWMAEIGSEPERWDEEIFGQLSESCINDIVGNWYTHPAFTLGDDELKGIWVGKFEVSTTDRKITIKPNVSSLRNQTVSNFYNSIQSMSMVYNLTSYDSHMIKNMEWGAIAYLKQSKYGLGIIDIGINNSINHITGCGATAGSSLSLTCNAYNTPNGMLASTTGNVTGVYDMSGGSFELVMGNMANSNNVFYSKNAGFASQPASKYYDLYIYGTSESNHARGKLGDATKETLKTFGNVSGGWNGDDMYIPTSDYPWFVRGGYYDGLNNTGIFTVDHHDGSLNEDATTRAVLTAK